MAGGHPRSWLGLMCDVWWCGLYLQWNEGLWAVLAGSEGFSCALQAVYVLKAERVGHGYHVVEDPELYKELLKIKMHFEVRMCGGSVTTR